MLSVASQLHIVKCVRENLQTHIMKRHTRGMQMFNLLIVQKRVLLCACWYRDGLVIL